MLSEEVKTALQIELCQAQRERQFLDMQISALRTLLGAEGERLLDPDEQRVLAREMEADDGPDNDEPF